MSYDHAKAGDRALLLPHPDSPDMPEWNGTVMNVLSDPERMKDGIMCNKIHPSGWYHPTCALIPYRGDPDAKSEPRQADVPRKVTA